ncbi:MAG: ABC transporter permease [Deltaproteobacteria bacterium]|nr:ABC transporter permease [Deltaproteobacteria bacterium]
MSLFGLVLRNLRLRGLSSTLTALSVALGTMLVTAILILQGALDRHYDAPGRGYQIVVGAPGSALQLVLNAVYHVDDAPGLMPMRVWWELEEDDSVALAVPYAVGDSFRGFRVVATTDAFFAGRSPHPEGEGAEKLAEGRPFRFDRERLEDVLRELGAELESASAAASASGGGPGLAQSHGATEGAEEEEFGPESEFESGSESAAHHDDEAEHHDDEDEHHDDEDELDGDEDEHHDDEDELDEDEDEHDHDEDEHVDDEDEHHEHETHYEAVVGAEVARTLGVRVGDRIEPTHGVEGGRAHDHEHLWEVVGILKPTDTPVDRLVLIPLDSFFSIEDHRGGALLPGTTEPGLSAVLVFPRPGVHKVMLLSRLNRRPEIQVADVHEEIGHLFDIVGSVDVLFLLVSILVIVVGLLSVLIALYNSMNERRREVAILRAIGAPRRWVLGSVVIEAALITAIGAGLGVLMGHALVALAAGRVESAAGFRPNALDVVPTEGLVVLLVVLAGALAGLWPAWKAYATDVAENLRPTS